MAKYDLYNTSKWRDLRKRIISRANGICELCGDKGTITHHVIEVSPDNIDNPLIVWNPDNLICVCTLCHERIHHGVATSIGEGLFFDCDGNLTEFRRKNDNK